MSNLNGILNLDKPAGWTSHDVVARVRRLLQQRTVGHAGTLDPMATGVLLVCVGQATRVVEYLMGGQKVYRAGIRLGVTTDTYDGEGRMVATAPVPPLTPADLSTALLRFTGAIDQLPPAYSAVKQAGIPAYRRARRGETVELAPRRVVIDRIDLLDWCPPDLSLDILCGPGTYIRSLAHDLGQALGCGATLVALTRLRSGSFTLEGAVSLDTLAAAGERIVDYLHPVTAALDGLVRVQVDPADAVHIAHGRAIGCPAPPDRETGYAVDPAGELLAILTYDAARVQWQPHKVFVTSD